jgi:hypothetical protein
MYLNKLISHQFDAYVRDRLQPDECCICTTILVVVQYKRTYA